MKFAGLLLVLLVCLTTVSSINIRELLRASSPGGSKTEKKSSSSSSSEGHHWGYKSKGADWEPEICKNGDKQSPININLADLKKGDKAPLKIKFDDQSVDTSTLKLAYNGHTIIVEPKQGRLGVFSFDGVEYDVKQFHFHAPAEHTINGNVANNFPLEVHFVSKSSDLLLVVGAFFNVSNESNKWLDSIGWEKLSSFTTKPEEKIAVKPDFKLSSFKPFSEYAKKPSEAHYVGSLTTPDCRQGVSWHLIDPVDTISKEQLKAIDAIFKANPKFANGNGNNRAVQAIKGHKLSFLGEKPTFSQKGGNQGDKKAEKNEKNEKDEKKAEKTEKAQKTDKKDTA